MTYRLWCTCWWCSAVFYASQCVTVYCKALTNAHSRGDQAPRGSGEKKNFRFWPDNMIMIYFENKLNILWQLHASGNFSEPHTASCWYHQIAFNMCSLQFDASFFCRTSVAQPFKFPPRMSSVPNLSKNIHRELISAARWQQASAETRPFQWSCAVLSFAVWMLRVGLRTLPARALLQDILQIKMKVCLEKKKKQKKNSLSWSA